MSGLFAAFLILIAAALLLALGLLTIKKSKKSKLVYACLIVWSMYMILAKQYDWNPMNTVSLRTAVLSPVGQFVEHYIFRVDSEE